MEYERKQVVLNNLTKKYLYNTFINECNHEYKLLKYNNMEYIVNPKTNYVIPLKARDGYIAYTPYVFLIRYGIFNTPNKQELLEIQRYEDRL